MQKVSIALTPAEWQTVANALSARPFAEVAELIGSIKQQFDAAQVPVEPSQPPPPVDAEGAIEAAVLASLPRLRRARRSS